MIYPHLNIMIPVILKDIQYTIYVLSCTVQREKCKREMFNLGEFAW